MGRAMIPRSLNWYVDESCLTPCDLVKGIFLRSENFLGWHLTSFFVYSTYRWILRRYSKVWLVSFNKRGSTTLLLALLLWRRTGIYGLPKMWISWFEALIKAGLSHIWNPLVTRLSIVQQVIPIMYILSQISGGSISFTWKEKLLISSFRKPGRYSFSMTYRYLL